MKKTILILALIFGLIVTATAMAQTKKGGAAKKAGQCVACHADGASLLPKGHKPAKVADIHGCTACHKPDLSGKPEPKPLSARLHRPHVKPPSSTECTLCHSWAPGKQFGLKGAKESLGKVTKADMELIKKAFASWADSTNLDSIHGKGDMVCLACHGKTLPEEGDTVEDDRCLACHGSREGLAAKTTPKDFADRNPHKSHLGDVACTVCHHAHKPSKVYCLGCHGKFTMKIPGGE